jgi:hypothetical protein
MVKKIIIQTSISLNVHGSGGLQYQAFGFFQTADGKH